MFRIIRKRNRVSGEPRSLVGGIGQEWVSRLEEWVHRGKSLRREGLHND